MAQHSEVESPKDRPNFMTKLWVLVGRCQTCSHKAEISYLPTLYFPTSSSLLLCYYTHLQVNSAGGNDSGCHSTAAGVAKGPRGAQQCGREDFLWDWYLWSDWTLWISTCYFCLLSYFLTAVCLSNWGSCKNKCMKGT